MDTQPQDPAVVGDDGELLQTDPDASPIKYAEYVAQLPLVTAAPAPVDPVERLIGSQYGGCLIMLVALCGVISVGVLVFAFVNSPDRPIGPKIPVSDRMALPEIGEALADDFGGPPLRDLSWSPDSRRLALLTVEDFLRVCDFDQARCIVAQQYGASVVDWSPLTGELITVNGQLIGRRDPADYFKSLQTVYDGDGVGAIRFLRPSPDGRSLAALTKLNRLLILDFETGAVRYDQPVSPSLAEVDWSPDSTALMGVDGQALWRWQAGTAETGPLDAALTYSAARWSPDGTRILLTGEKRSGRLATPFIQMIGIGAADQRMTLTPLANIDLTDAQLRTNTPRRVGAAWSPDGAQIMAFVSGGKTLYRFNADLSESREPLEIPYSLGITDARWSPDGRYIAFISGTILVLWSPPLEG
jgi:dipeptidyl aminopeptidase/acylaminoacyl peptidase